MLDSKKRSDGLEETYRRIRKPVPPPERVEEDRRRKIREREESKEAERDFGEEER
ncbi:MAG: hypothetical protein ABR507_12520 [Actinomycetota bacterium]|nr:hypothetical protein [Actinomycetota bacterium]